MGKMVVELKWDTEQLGPYWMNEDNLRLLMYSKNFYTLKDLVQVKQLSHSDDKPEAFPLLKSIASAFKGKQEEESVQLKLRLSKTDWAQKLSSEELYHAVVAAWSKVTTDEFSDREPDSLKWGEVCRVLMNRHQREVCYENNTDNVG